MCPNPRWERSEQLTGLGLTADDVFILSRRLRRGAVEPRDHERLFRCFALLHDDLARLYRFYGDDPASWLIVDPRRLIYPQLRCEADSLFLIGELERFVGGQERLTAREWLEQTIFILGAICAEERTELYDSEARFFERDVEPFLVQLSHATLAAMQELMVA